MGTYRLIQRVVPYKHELLSSFLMRAADANGYRRFQDILTLALGSKKTNPHVQMDQVEQLADYTRTSVSELCQLSGISRRIPRLGPIWLVNGEWVKKFAFVNFRVTQICPHCLVAEGYLRGDWSLVLNTACCTHGTLLLNRCPRCREILTTNRYSPESCWCGFDLRESPCVDASPQEILVAQLTNARSNPSRSLDTPCLPIAQIQNLAQLSLEGLCQSLWFLGHDLYCQLPLGTGRGHHKLSRVEVQQIINGAFWMLADWPDRLRATLHRLVQDSLEGADLSSLARLLGPMQRYFERHVSGDARFISIPYEVFVRQIASRFGQMRRLRDFESPQLQLDLE